MDRKGVKFGSRLFRGKTETLYFSDVRSDLKESFHVTYRMTSERSLSPRDYKSGCRSLIIKQFGNADTGLAGGF